MVSLLLPLRFVAADLHLASPPLFRVSCLVSLWVLFFWGGRAPSPWEASLTLCKTHARSKSLIPRSKSNPTVHSFLIRAGICGPRLLDVATGGVWDSFVLLSAPQDFGMLGVFCARFSPREASYSTLPD